MTSCRNLLLCVLLLFCFLLSNVSWHGSAAAPSGLDLRPGVPSSVLGAAGDRDDWSKTRLLRRRTHC